MDSKLIPSVSIDDIAISLRMVSEGADLYLDTETGDIIPITERETTPLEPEDEDKIEDDQESPISLMNITDNDGKRFLKLPDEFEIQEIEIMKHFAQAQEDQRIGRALEQAIHAAGAFQNFRDEVEVNMLVKNWTEFQHHALKKIALDWCAENNITLEGDPF